MICIGHRGARGHEPENTLRSVRRALELGAEAVEVDVYFVDGQLIVFHDATLERTTNGRGRLRRKSFEYLRGLNAGKGEQIPTLGEVFDTVDRRAWINVELKGRGTAAPVAELIRRYVHKHGRSFDDFIVSSFRRRELRALREAEDGKKIRLGILFHRRARRLRALAAQLGAYAVHPNVRFTNARLVRTAHDLGLKVFPYTVNTPKDIARMRALEVDGVFTDFPERV